MTLTIVEDLPTRLAEYAQVPMAFTVAERFDDQALTALRHDAPSRPSRSHHPVERLRFLSRQPSLRLDRSVRTLALDYSRGL